MEKSGKSLGRQQHSHSPFNCSLSILLEFPVDTGYDVKNSTNTSLPLCVSGCTRLTARTLCIKEEELPSIGFRAEFDRFSLMPSFVDNDDDDSVFPSSSSSLEPKMKKKKKRKNDARDGTMSSICYQTPETMLRDEGKIDACIICLYSFTMRTKWIKWKQRETLLNDGFQQRTKTLSSDHNHNGL